MRQLRRRDVRELRLRGDGLSTLRNLWWRFVFWYKKRTGWLDLGETITATGTVIRVDAPGTDGDGNFDVELDAGQERLITGFGGRLTCCPPVTTPSLHCEVEPWASAELLAAFRGLHPGDRVRVTGRWGFDGVHAGRTEWLEILLALVRHMPNVRAGWFECHPVESIATSSPAR